MEREGNIERERDRRSAERERELLSPSNPTMSDDNWFPDVEDHDNRNHYSLNRVLLAAVLSLFFVVVLVIILHIYARCVLRRRSRRRIVIRQLSMGVAPAQGHTRETPKMGLDPSVIAALPIFVYKYSDQTDGADVECSVCLSAIEEDEPARLLPNCKHTFHAQCIDMWLHSHSTCPICRTGAEPKPGEENGDRTAAIDASAPPLNVVSQDLSAGPEGTSDVTGQSPKMGGSGSRLSSFRRMINWERSERRLQYCGQADGVEDLERQ